MLNEFEITYANKGKFEKSKGVPILILYNGETRIIKLQILSFLNQIFY